MEPTLMLVAVLAASTATSDTVAMKHPPEKYEIVVSATRTAKDPVQVPNTVSVVRGDDLRRRATRTLAEALQDVPGLDIGEGSDNGMHLPNLGLWGLKEFDALLVTLDGVPLGGPFNPELHEVPVDEIDRIEVVNGPQGTLYGVSAFAGMVQIFSRGAEGGLGHITLGGGSFDQGYGSASIQRQIGTGWTARAWGQVQRAEGWQDRTGSDIDRGRVSLNGEMGKGKLALSVDAYRDAQAWGSPLPVERVGTTTEGEFLDGFKVDKNYAVLGAEVVHHVVQGTATGSWSLEHGMRLENTLGIANDKSHQLRSFTEPDAATGNDVPSEGIELHPKFTTAYEDLRLVTNFAAGGAHELVTGAAVTWGHIEADGRGFDFDQNIATDSIPDAASIPPGDVRSFDDKRTFFGFYAHDEWTPVRAFTISGGGRWDQASEDLHTEFQEQAPGEPFLQSDDSRDDNAWSGDLAGLVRLLPESGAGGLDVANVYANWKSSFKPAAPNLSEGEEAEILDPERTHSVEVGLKTRGLGRQVGLDVAWFDMKFNNMVVSILGSGGTPELVNAGSERFRGVETSLSVSPDAIPGVSLTVGYAHHNARFVDFTFVTPDGQFRDVSGNKLELVPRDMVNAKLQVTTPTGIGGFVAVRNQGERPFNRRNTFFAESYSEVDAGLSAAMRSFRVAVTGRNLGDDRHVVTESELGDAQFYPAPPRRFVAEVGYNF